MTERFFEKLRTSLEDGTFVKLTLSRPREKGGPRNVYGRIVDLKGGRAVSFTIRHPNRDVTRNESPAGAVKVVGDWLAREFEEAHLFTTTGDWRLRLRPGGEPQLRASRPAFSITPTPEHDRTKTRAVGNAPFLVKLGVTAPDGTARPGMADKLRQVERFVEIFGHLVEVTPLASAAMVRGCDMGAGKGYLTFAVHDFFRRRDTAAEITGIEQREELVSLCNGVARELNCEGLSFQQGIIEKFALPPKLDLLIALHACDTATDDALAAGVRAGAGLIIAAPCCHKEVRRQLVAPAALVEVLSHGILAERQAELLTDGLRAMALEACGYDAKVFEFISSEHTGKNVMIAAAKRDDPDPLKWSRLREVMREFGIAKQRLVEMLGSDLRFAP
jgi:hypothetical protein